MNREAIARHQEGVQLQQAGHLREAADAYLAALELDARLELTRSNLAMAFFQLGEIDQAIAQYKQLLEAHPLNVKARYNLGVVFASIGRYDQATAEYRQVLNLEPGHAMARSNLAWILQQQQRHGEAISELEHLRALTPDDTNVLYQLGVLHKQIGDLDQARWFWQAVVAADPRHIGALLALADDARQAGDATATLGHALDALGVDPQHPAAQIMAARAHMQLLEYRQASEILEALAQRLPHSGEVRYHLGVLAHERGDLEEARVHLSEACRLDDHHAEYHNELATVLYRLGAFEDAVDHFREAESLAPENPVIKANLGFCYMALGEHAAAAQYFEAFQARPGGGESVRLAVQCAMDLL